jgi:hypothetical protein
VLVENKTKEYQMENTKRMFELEKQVNSYVKDIFAPNFMKSEYIKSEYTEEQKITRISFWFDVQKRNLTFNFSYKKNKIDIRVLFSAIWQDIFEIDENENIEEIFKHINMHMKKEQLKNLYRGRK